MESQVIYVVCLHILPFQSFIGFVIITAPEGRVKSYITEELSCKTKRDIGEANWYLQREEHNITGIHGGTEVELTHDKPNNKSTANLKKTSHIWRGMFQCLMSSSVFFFPCGCGLNMNEYL